MKTLVVTTKATLDKDELNKLQRIAKLEPLTLDTPISKVLTSLRNRPDACGGKTVDFVAFLKVDSDAGDKYFDPISIDQEVELNSHIVLKIETQSLLNMQFEMAGFNSELISQWREDQIMEMLPALLYVDVRNIQTLIEVPKELTVDFFKQAIEDNGLPITNSYKTVAYVCESPGKGYYVVKVVPNTKNEVKAVFNGEEQVSTIDKLKMEYIHGVLFERRSPDL